MARGTRIAELVAGLMPISMNGAYPTGKFSGRRYLSSMGKYYKAHLDTALHQGWDHVHDYASWPDKLVLRITLWMPEATLMTKKGTQKIFDTSNYFKLTEDTVASVAGVDDKHNWEIRSEKCFRFEEFPMVEVSGLQVVGLDPIPAVQIEIFEYVESRESPRNLDYLPIVECPYCSGKGKHKPPPKYGGKPKKCPVCSGQGKVIAPRYPFNPGKLSVKKTRKTMKESGKAKRCCTKKDFHIAKHGPYKNPHGKNVWILECLDCGHFVEVDW